MNLVFEYCGKEKEQLGKLQIPNCSFILNYLFVNFFSWSPITSLNEKPVVSSGNS